MSEALYPHVLRYVAETPWAIRPETFAVIREVVSLRAAGVRFDEEELEERLAAARERQAARPRPVSGGAVAVIPLMGVIVPRASMFSQMSGGTSLDRFRSQIRKAAADPDIGSIVLDVDSPGGSVDLVPEAAADIRQARANKRVVAVANTEAASAAYWLASQADELVVTPSGAVGSIGVFAAHEDYSVALEMEGIKTTLVSAGKYKVEGNPFEPLTDEARQAIQDDVDHYYGMFVADVAKGRGTTAGKVRAGFGEGRMVTAQRAVELGMADRVGTLEDTIARAARGGVRAVAESPASLIAAGPFYTCTLTPGTLTTDTTNGVNGEEPDADQHEDPPAMVDGSEALLREPAFLRVFAPATTTTKGE